MANNRMYIRCGNCGEAMLLAKNLGAEWTTWSPAEERLDEFFADHSACGHADDHFDNSTTFGIAYESAPHGNAELPTDASIWESKSVR